MVTATVAGFVTICVLSYERKGGGRQSGSQLWFFINL